jgi:hypothetical protein
LFGRRRRLRAHFLRLADDERRLPCHDLLSGGIVNVEGDDKTHVINIHGNRLELVGKG